MIHFYTLKCILSYETMLQVNTVPEKKLIGHSKGCSHAVSFLVFLHDKTS